MKLNIEPGIFILVEIPKTRKFSLTKVVRLEHDGIVVMYHSWAERTPELEPLFLLEQKGPLPCEERKGSYFAWQSWLTSLNAIDDSAVITSAIPIIKLFTATHNLPVCRTCFPELL